MAKTVSAEESRAKEVLKAKNRELFLVIGVWPKALHSDIRSLYYFLRTMDDFVDSSPPKAEEYFRFKSDFHAALSGRRTGNKLPDDFAEVALRKRFDPGRLRHFFDAMELDLSVKRYETMADLDRFILGAAEAPGYFICATVGFDAAATDCFLKACRAIQYSSMIRDVGEDLRLGRTYFPQEDLRACGMERLDEEYARAHDAGFRKLIGMELARYREFNSAARAGLKDIPARYRPSVKTALEMYGFAPEKVARDPYLVFNEGGKIRPPIPAVFLRFGVNSLFLGLPLLTEGERAARKRARSPSRTNV